MDIKSKAREFAIKAHANQVRKSEPDKPMIIHPIAVAKILEEYGYDDNVVAAGYLHDIDEDTKYTIEDLEKIISFFGDCKNKEVKENKLITTYRNVDFEFEDWEEDGFAINWLMSYSEETDSYYLDFPMEEIEVDDFYYYLQDVYKDAKVLKEKIEK